MLITGLFLLFLLPQILGVADSLEGKYTGTGDIMFSTDLYFCKSDSHYIGRMLDKEKNTKGFIYCSNSYLGSYLCNYFLGNGMQGTTTFDDKLVGTQLTGQRMFDPTTVNSDVTYFPKMNLVFSQKSTQTSPGECVGQQSFLWGTKYVDAYNNTFHLCRSNDNLIFFTGYYPNFVSPKTPNDPPKSIQIYGRMAGAVGGGHWFNTNDKDDFGGILIANGVAGRYSNTIRLYLYKGLDFEVFDILDLNETASQQTPNKESTDHCVVDPSQSYSGYFADYKLGRYYFLNHAGNFFGYWSSYSALTIGMFVGKLDKTKQRVSGNCYSVGSYSTKNDTFWIDFRLGSINNRCTDQTTFFDKKTSFTTIWKSFALLGYNPTNDEDLGMTGNYFEGIASKPISLCRLNKSNLGVSSYHNTEGYMEGIFFENNRVFVAPYSDWNDMEVPGEDLQSSGIQIMAQIAPGQYFIQTMRSIANCYGCDSIGQVEYTGAFYSQPEKTGNLDLSPGVGPWSDCVSNSKPVPFSPFGDYHPKPPPHKKTSSDWWVSWWFIICCCSIVLIFLIAFFCVLYQGMMIRVRRKRRLAHQRRSYNHLVDDDNYETAPIFQSPNSNNSINNIVPIGLSSNDDDDFIVPPSPQDPTNVYGSFSSPQQPVSSTDENVMMPVSGARQQSPSSPAEPNSPVEYNSGPIDPPESEDIEYSKFGLTTRIRLHYFDETSDPLRKQWVVVFELMYNPELEEFVAPKSNVLINELESKKIIPNVFSSMQDIEEVRKRFNWNQRNLRPTLDTVNGEWSWKGIKWVLQRS